MKQQQLKKTVLASLLTLTSGLVLSAPYDVVDLGGLGGNYSVAFGINEQGVAVGTANGPLDENDEREFNAHAVLFNESFTSDLGVLEGGSLSEATDINSSMIAVGYANVITETELENGGTATTIQNFATVFDNGTAQKLPSNENLVQTKAYALNDNNLIVGTGYFLPEGSQESYERGFIYDYNNSIYTLVEPLTNEQERQSYLVDINESGLALGYSDALLDSVTFTIKSFVFNTSNSEISELPTFEDSYTFAQGINVHNEIVGSVQFSLTSPRQEAFYYDLNSGSDALTFLGFFQPDFNDSRARDINDNGQIVGRALASSPTLNEYAAFIYENDEMKNLNELIPCDSGWKLTEATSINNSGQIVGFGVKDGEIRAFRLDPTSGEAEVCETEEDNKSGGGSIPLITLMLLAFVGFKRKLKL
ncbi:DUF3466 family protein [Kangiella aquimarina]|uniref:DUF3466 family protein n=1 Tax=Kangiella aquimarina TaxID=261965 RepID=A0ABZ0X172_9GAMM|nr:DUF3466 family protein [Kangiella aquimarina]WQG84244.1 DUF3466 family protein [Kangiella aquimarina]